ncbi:hypothetical protein BGZ88_006963 [Linnemannia elongata]|nr:hypothetical protein BGZ88_006963 [Linnemannia elongata]
MDPSYTTPSTPLTTTTYIDPTTSTTTEPVSTTATTTEPVTTTTPTTLPPTTTISTTLPPTTTTTITTTEPPPTTTTTTTVPPPPTTTTTEPPPTTTRTRTTRTRSTTTPYTSSTTNSDPVVPTTSYSTTTSNTITSPTLPPDNHTGGGMSSGAIIGIVIAALLALIAALISAFLIKRRRRRRFNQTSDTLFNPVNNNATLSMQENQNYHPVTSSRKDYPSGVGGGLRGRESVEPLNAHSVATTILGNNANNRISSGGSDNSGDSGAIAAASGLQQDGLYPFEADPAGYYHSGAGVNYVPPTEPSYSQYGGWNDPASSSEYNMMPGVPPAGEYPNDPAEAAAYAQYEQEQRDMYLHQLMMMQRHGQDQGDLSAPVEYYDPGTSTDYYSSSVYPQPPPVSAHPSQLQQHSHGPQYDEDRSAPVSMISGSVLSTPLIAATAMAPTSAPISVPGAQPTTAATASTPSSVINSPGSEPRSVRQYYDLTENDVAYNSKSEPWASPRRNPQVLINPANVASSSSAAAGAGTREAAADDQSKVLVSGESPYANDAMTRPM